MLQVQSTLLLRQEWFPLLLMAGAKGLSPPWYPLLLLVQLVYMAVLLSPVSLMLALMLRMTPAAVLLQIFLC